MLKKSNWSKFNNFVKLVIGLMVIFLIATGIFVKIKQPSNPSLTEQIAEQKRKIFEMNKLENQALQDGDMEGYKYFTEKNAKQKAWYIKLVDDQEEINKKAQ